MQIAQLRYMSCGRIIYSFIFHFSLCILLFAFGVSSLFPLPSSFFPLPSSFVLRPSSLVYRHSYSPDRHQRFFRFLSSPYLASQLVVKVPDRFLHLTLHVLHLLAHREDHLHAREVNSELARQPHDHLQLFNVLIGIKPRVPPAALRRDKSLPFIQPQCLRVYPEDLGYHAYHVKPLFPCCHLFTHSPIHRFLNPLKVTSCLGLEI